MYVRNGVITKDNKAVISVVCSYCLGERCPYLYFQGRDDMLIKCQNFKKIDTNIDFLLF